MNEKSKLRVIVKRKFVENRLQLPVLSKAVNHKLELDEAFLNAKVVAMFWSLPDEVYTHALVKKWYKHKTILLPSIQGEIIELKKFNGQENMKLGNTYHIPEPVNDFYKDYDKIDAIVVPGVAFDKNRNRLGRGRGFYDRLLPRFNCTKVGICYNFQVFENIPCEPHDIKVDKLIY